MYLGGIFGSAQQIAYVRLTRPNQDRTDGAVPSQIGEGFTPHLRPVDANIEILETISDADWIGLHRRFANQDSHVLRDVGPWNRCLAVLRENGAVSCVIEHYYVCLDYKSEVIAFYSQLDAPHSTTATRLHFFGERITLDQVFELSSAQVKSYLGYVVCRGGSLPLVGRSVIRCPDYIDTHVSIEESVNFLGQKLVVEGVPFMQQDQEVAVCSDVALWAALYMAHRRGLTQRRLIAEVALLIQRMIPMMPHASTGVRHDDATRTLREAGLRGARFQPPNNSDGFLPVVRASEVFGAPELIKKVAEMASIRSLRPSMRILGKRLRDSPNPEADAVKYNFWLNYNIADINDRKLKSIADELSDALLAHHIEPYLRSRIPVYAATKTHAQLIVGTRKDTYGTTFFVHDDQYGPYLALTSLVNGDRSELSHQSLIGSGLARYGPVFSKDLIRDKAMMVVSRKVKKQTTYLSTSPTAPLNIEFFVVPLPPRVFLPPAAALKDAIDLIRYASATADGEAHIQLPTHETGRWDFRTVLLMGVDYKRDRCDQISALKPRESSVGFGAMHIAEWVVVVEGKLKGSPKVSWEVVYDATAVDQCIIQAARFGENVLCRDPRSSESVQGAVLPLSEFHELVVSSRVGKVTDRSGNIDG